MATPHLSTADAEVSALAERMRTKLPRELHDMIYASVLDETAIHAIEFPQMLHPCPRATGCIGPSCFCKRLASSTPAIVKKDIVGADIAAEAAEWMYENSPYIKIGQPDQFPKFFTDDLFGVGVRAKDCRLRKLTSIIQIPGHVASTDMDHAFGFVIQSQRHADFKLCIRIQQPFWSPDHWLSFEALGKMLGEPVKNFEQENIKVRVVEEMGTLNPCSSRWLEAMGCSS